MSNTRPSAARKQTRSTEANRENELERGIRINLDGEVHEVRVGDVTSTLARELRRASGMSFQTLMREVTADPDLDSIAAFVWLARRMAGETVELDDVLVTYTQLLDGFEIEVAGKRAEDADPEA